MPPNSSKHENNGAEHQSMLLHRFNQPLTAIGNYAQAGCHLIDQGIHDPARLRELFEKISYQCTRASALSLELGNSIRETGETR